MVDDGVDGDDGDGDDSDGYGYVYGYSYGDYDDGGDGDDNGDGKDTKKPTWWWCCKANRSCTGSAGLAACRYAYQLWQAPQRGCKE